jgi:hypothetical protein
MKGYLSLNSGLLMNNPELSHYMAARAIEHSTPIGLPFYSLLPPVSPAATHIEAFQACPFKF